MKTAYLFAASIIVIVIASAGIPINAQGQAGGGSLSREASGGAALIFRRPDNPTVNASGGVAGTSATGGRTSRRTRVRTTPAVAHEQVIAKANAARSAPVPRYTEAEQQYKLAAQEQPDDARAHFGLGNVFLDQGRFAEAVDAYRQALKMKPDYVQVYHPLSYSLARLNRFPESIETLKQAIQYDPNNAELFNNLAFAYVHSEQFQQAVEACLQAIKLLGQTGEAFQQGLQVRNEVLSHAYKNLGNAYNGLKKYNEAADALKHAADIEPTNASAHFNLGLALFNGGRYSEAIEAYKAVITLRPNLAVAHYNLGLTYVAINDRVAARKEYEILKPLDEAMAIDLQKVIKN